MRRIEIGSGIAQRRAGGIIGMVEDEVLAREASDTRHDRRRECHPTGAWRDVALPSAPHHRVAAIHQKAVAGVGGFDEIVDDRRDVVEQREAKFAAAIEHLVEQPAVAVGGDGRTQDLHIGHGLDQALRVTRRAVEIDNDRIVRIVGRNRDGRARYNSVVGPDGRRNFAPRTPAIPPEQFRT